MNHTQWIGEPREAVETSECPLTTSELELIGYLTKIRDMNAFSQDFHYRGVGDFLLQHGRFFLPQPLARPELRGRIKQCFANATMASINGSRPGRRLHYIEGYATLIIPTHHAWCADDDGNAYEVTWPEVGSAYLGIAFPPRVIHRGPALDDWKGGYELYRKPFETMKQALTRSSCGHGIVKP